MIQNIFSSPVGSNILNVDCRAIEKVCYDQKSKDLKGAKKSNVIGWQSMSFDVTNYDKSHHELFLDEILGEIKKFSIEIKCNFNLYIANYWININSPNSYNKSHCHPQSFLSGCLYIKVPDRNCGSIFFEHPSCDLIESYMNYYHKYSDDYRDLFPVNWFYEPTEGQCLIFPAWLKHRVESNLSKEDRISISFNVGIS